MSEFLQVLAFSWIPFVGALAFALTAAPLGAVLSLRDEILLGLALPPVGTASIVIAVFAGVSADSTLALYACAVIGILLVSLALGGKGHGTMASPRRRGALLACIFCAGEAATILLSAMSTNVEAHLRHLLRGEILAIGVEGLVGFLCLTTVVLFLGVRKRGLVYALAIDEEGLLVRTLAKGRLVLFVFRVLSAVLIAAGVIWVGPLLTLGLLAIPTMLWERRAPNLTWFFSGVTVIGFSSVVLGFAGSIVVDLPPVPVVICALFAVGAVFALLKRG